jgi:hypothetical protein
MDIFALALKISSEGGEKVIGELEHIAEQGELTAGSFGALTTAALAFAGVVVGEKAIEGLAEVMTAAGEAEIAVMDLSQSLKNVGDSAGTVTPAMKQYADQIEDTTRFSYTAAIAAEANLVALTHNREGYRLLGVAADLAAFKHMGLAEASTIVARAADGNTTMLRRLGIEVEKGGDGIAALRSHLGGFAEAEGNTFIGSLDKIRNQFERMMEKAGEAIITNADFRSGIFAIVEKLKDAVEWIGRHNAQISAMAGAVTRVARDITEHLVSAFDDLKNATNGWWMIWTLAEAGIRELPAVGEKAFGSFMISLGTLLSGAGSMIDTFFGTDLAASADEITSTGRDMMQEGQQQIDVFELLASHKIEAIQRLAMSAKKSLEEGGGGDSGTWSPPPKGETDEERKKRLEAEMKEVDGLVKLHELRQITSADLDQAYRLDRLYAFALQAGNLSFDERVQKLEALNKLQKAGLGLTFDWSHLITTEPKPIKIDVIPNVELSKWEEIISASMDTVDMVFQNFSLNVTASLEDSLAGAFENGFKNGGQVLLQGLGSIFIDMGKALVSYGVLMTGLLSALTNPFTSGPAAIAAGAALIALGGALRGISHGGSSPGAVGAGFSSAGGSTLGGPGTVYTLPSSYNGGAVAQPVQPIVVNANIIGPNDPTAQRGITELITNAVMRGLVPRGLATA